MVCFQVSVAAINFVCGAICVCNGGKCADYNDSGAAAFCYLLGGLCIGLGVWNLCRFTESPDNPSTTEGTQMAYEERDGQGTLFINKRKQDGDNKPDREGTCTIDGVKYRIAGWLKTPKNGGDKFLSLKIEPADTHSHSRNSGYSNSRPDTPGNIPPDEDGTPF